MSTPTMRNGFRVCELDGCGADSRSNHSRFCEAHSEHRNTAARFAPADQTETIARWRVRLELLGYVVEWRVLGVCS